MGDINKIDPKYVYSNLQYNRFIRNKDDYVQKPFNTAFLDHNFYLLVDTIKTMSNKMLVNWMDIIPYDMRTYKQSKLYINTFDTFNNKKLSDWDVTNLNVKNSDEQVYENAMLAINGLSIEDIYNTLSNDLYHDIKFIKWLIYDIPANNILLPLIITLPAFFSTKEMVDGTGIEWSNLSDKYISKFSIEWKELIDIAINGHSYQIYDYLSISGKSLRVMIKSIIGAFNNNHNRFLYDAIADKTNPYIKFEKSDNKNDDANDDDDDNDVTNFKLYVPSLNSVHPKYIYNFIKDSLQQIKGTWYGLQLLTADKTDIKTLKKNNRNTHKLQFGIKCI